MKKSENKFLRYILLGLMLMAIMPTGCSDDDEYTYHHLKLSSYSYTFDTEDAGTFTVQVSSSAEWTVEPWQEEWITTSSADENSVTFAVTENISETRRSIDIVISNTATDATITIAQLGAAEKYARYRKMTDFYPACISHKGYYVGHVRVGLSDDQEYYVYYPEIINLRTGEVTSLPSTTSATEARAISDSGVFLVALTDEMAGAYYDAAGNLHYLEKGGYHSAFGDGISSDGTTIVGQVFAGSAWRYYPAKWVNGELQVLDAPETQFTGNPVETGFMARACSADGTVIYGSSWDYPNFITVAWKNGVFSFIGEDIIEKQTVEHSWGVEDYYSLPVLYAEYTNISPSGKYLAATYERKIVYGEYYISSQAPACLDLEQGVSNILSGSGTATTVSNDGVVFSTSSYAYNSITGETALITDWVKQNYGVIIPGGSWIMRICEESKAVLGITPEGTNFRYWYINNF